MNNTSELIKNIKAQFRSFMNGAVSHSMRQKGLDEYKLNFGIEMPRIKEIAIQYEPDIALAESLWIENIRECKILATMLYPKDKFDMETAAIWVQQTPNVEIAQMLCMNLLQHMPYAPNMSFVWIANEQPLIQTIGYLTISRILPRGVEMNGRAAEEFANQLAVAAQSDNFQLRHAAKLAAISFMEQGEDSKNLILASLEPLEDSNNEFGKTFFCAVSEEASYL